MDYKKLDEIATDFRYGKMPDKSRIKDNGLYPVWSGYRYVGFYDEKNVNKNEIVVVARGVGGTGDVKMAVEDCYLTNLSIAFTVNEDINPLYVYYFYKIKNLRYLDSGSAQSQITINDLKNVIIPIPSKKRQDKIVKVLNKIDKKIELNNKVNNNLLNLIKNMYLKMQENMSEFENVKLKDIANISSGKRPKNKGNEYNIPLIGASGIMSYTEDYNSDTDILVIGRVGTLGVVQRYFDKIWLSDNTLTIKTKFSNVLENYLKYVDYQSLNRGSTQPLITQKDISNLYIKFNEKEFNKFEDEVTNLRKKIELNNKQNKILEQLRDTLLPKLMNGEIDLDNIEI